MKNIPPPRALLPVFDADDAAYLSGAKTSAVRRWMAMLTGPGLARVDPDAETFLNFYDVMELMAVTGLRRQHHIPLQRIREAVKTCKERYGIDRPFAMERKTKLFGKDILVEIRGQPVLVTGNEKHQNMFQDIVEPLAQDIRFDEDGYAYSYTPISKAKYRVEMNADLGFGKPLVQPCGLSPGLLVYAVETEGSVSKAARMYEVDEEAVRVAQEFHRQRQRAALAKAA